MLRVVAVAVLVAACSPRPDPMSDGGDVSDAGVDAGPPPLGAWLRADGLYVSVLSQRATGIELSVFASASEPDAAVTLPLTRETGTDRWSAVVPTGQLPGGTLYYGYRASGPNPPGMVDAEGNRFDPSRLLIDPWARELSNDPSVGGSRGVVLDSAPLDTGTKPTRPFADDVVYEVHVRGLTMNDSSVPMACRGTYAGAATKAQYLKDLGVTAIELLPVAETNNDSNDVNPNSASGDNYWGYSTLAYFAPDRRYACDKSPGGPTREFAAMVKAFHDVGLKVLVDVVYNHTAEGAGGRTSLRLLDNAGYYELDATKQGFVDNSGVGANVNVANPMAAELVLGSLKYWWQTLGVDGFRFDLAPVLGNTCTTACFNFDKNALPARIARELPGAVLIAEPWGFGTGTYQLGNFPSGWSEWNGEFRDGIRRVQNKLNVEAVTPATVKELLSGSPAKFGARTSLNFIVSHDGFTLRDLYACNVKDNAQAWPYGPSNGGDDNNLSWDQGADPLRQKAAARTALTVLLMAQGAAMLTGGDELLRSQRCNNNPFNIDSVGTWVDWAALGATNADVQAFTKRLLGLRSSNAALRSGTRTWQRADGAEPDGAYLGNAANTYLSFSAGDVFVAWNWGTAGVMAVLPGGKSWALVSDSGSGTVNEAGSETPVAGTAYSLGARSAAVFVVR